MILWLLAFLLLAPPAQADSLALIGVGAGSGAATATPFLYYHVPSATNAVGGGVTLRSPVLPGVEVQASDTIVLGVTVPHGTTISITDTLGLSWPAATCTADGGTGNYASSIYAVNVGASPSSTVDTITINVGATDIQPVQYVVSVFGNVATSSAVNGSLCLGNITPTGAALISPGSFTPTTNNNANGGNIIWNYTALCGTAGSNASNWVAASGFTLLNGDIIGTDDQSFPWASQWEVQATQGSVTPSITSTGDTTDCFNSASMALKVANTGTAPSTIHVAKVIHNSCKGTSCAATIKFLAPSIGNLRVITTTFLNSTYGITGISDNHSACTWNTITSGTAGTDSKTFYAQNCPADATLQITFTASAAASGQLSWRYYDIQNAATSSFDVTASNEAACGTSFTGFPTITPLSGDNLAITQIGNGNGPITAITNPTSPAPIFDLWLFTCTGCTKDNDQADNADYTGHQYSPATSSTSWNGTKTNGADQCYARSQTFK